MFLQMKNYTVLAASFLVTCVIAAVVFLEFNKDDIAISFSETRDQVTLSVSFPDEDSKRVQDYVKAQLKMTDLSDLKNLEVKQYHTPDQQMRFSIKSRDGYIKIALDKIKNPPAAYSRLKKIGNGLNTLLTQR
jgi:hypothetical protein